MFDWLSDFGSFLGDIGTNISDSLSNLFGGSSDIVPLAESANMWYDPTLNNPLIDSSAIGYGTSGFLNSIGTNGFNPTDIVNNATASGGYDWIKGGNIGGVSIPGVMGAVGGIAQYLNGRNNASDTRDATNRAAAAADPFASQRAIYQEQLRKMMLDPSGYLNNIPGYRAGMDAGIEQVKRNAAKAGRLDSGNINYDLLDYGTKYALDQFNKQQDALGGFAGANINGGGAAANSIMQGNLDAQKQTAYGLQALFAPWKEASANADLSAKIKELANTL